MHDFGLSPEAIATCLGAARSVATIDGTFEAHERELLGAAARTLGFTGALDEVPAASPERAREVLTDPTHRTRLVQALLLVAMMDGDIAERELAEIRRYAKALDVDEPRLASLKQVAEGHTTIVKWDLIRRSQMVNDSAIAAWKKKGLKGLVQFAGGFYGFTQDPEIAWRYKKLGLLPEGTFGRTYWQHMTSRSYAFPGEIKGFPEELVKHDLSHVLGGYDTDPIGECEVVSFISGFLKRDPFGFLFMIFLHMQLGVHIFDGSPVEHMIIPADRVLAALERGTNVTRDLYDPAWDYFADFPLPLQEVRAKYGVAY
ncbi:MAG: hypothetical protein IPM79_03380 [Polyangiaceae bacterium]|jgi:tellurite resistance protein|nr:hypothetical protein [Polyangiaceae bacterium]MBK8936704.1 hypothetical protein [Polyangiaceae bacterium]